MLAPGSLAGKRVLVTAGGTREPLDSVRFLGNRSSGRMGVALAEEARRRGAEVILLAANLAVEPPHGIETIPTPTAEAMLDARSRCPTSTSRCSRRPSPTTGRPRRSPAKRPKDERGLDARARADRPTSRAPLGEQKRRRPGAGRLRRRARGRGLERKRAMLETKNADLVVFNDVGRTDIGFDARENEVVLDRRATASGGREGVASRRSPAAILDEVERLLPQ